MANLESVERLQQGVEEWNQWRLKNPTILTIDLAQADLSEANLHKANLAGADLHEANLNAADLSAANLFQANLQAIQLNGADLCQANLAGADLRQASAIEADLHQAILSGADLSQADLSQAILSETDLSMANLHQANLSEAYLGGAHLFQANLIGANLSDAQFNQANLREAQLNQAIFSNTSLVRADLTGADLSGTSEQKTDLSGTDLSKAHLVETHLENTKLHNCRIYGISAWNLNLEGTEQRSLIINRKDEAEITVDDLEVAQFVYLILNNQKIRNVLTTVGQKGVLILGRFTGEGRKEILDAIRDNLRQQDYLPMVFDFERPTERDFTETVKTLAGMCAFIIADITNPKSTPLELQATVPDYMIPFAPILQDGELPFAMFRDLQQKYNWVLDVFPYFDKDDLIENLDEVIQPALQKKEELTQSKAEGFRVVKRQRSPKKS
ncbi:pentapeptide repeat-containing protein [Synechococcus sp. PCC 7336]|uniref:pentapeptide repeat-containing protein n=1 Tax=Synechococcus sp. PCC 7336 TaxID=195250 RepID=UPI00034C0141|nr:pentapeptide repeat-containing protein [Synechococcus sp. PCC 7336]